MIEDGLPAAVRVPAISVVMSARNEAPYVADAVRSVLAQRFADFELIVRDDGSEDDTGNILARLAATDDRIRFQRGNEVLGLAGSGNAVVASARAPIVARMDADDVAHPRWLSSLFDTITRHPGAVLVGCLWSGIDAQGRHVRDADRWRAGRSSPFPPFGHGSSMFRKAAFDRVGGYRRECVYWEDLDLVLRMAREGSIIFLPTTLYKYRASDSSTRLVSNPASVEWAVDTMYACVDAYVREGDYERVLASAAGSAQRLESQPRRTSLRTLVALSSNRLWNARRPGQWRQVVAGARRPFTWSTGVSFLIAIWSEIHPRSLRSVLAAFIRARSPFADLPADGTPVVWDPRRAIARGND